MASRWEAEKLVRHLYVAEKVKAENPGLYYIVDRITDAINQSRKVTFHYQDYTPAKTKFLRHGGASYFVSPYTLLWDDNHYYMVGFYDKRQAVNVLRVDRICDLEISEETVVPEPEDFHIEDYAQQVFNMFAGEKQDVVLECRKGV